MVELVGDRLYVRSALRMADADAVRSAGDRVLPAGDVIVDLSGLGEVDSSALAVLLHWLRRQQAAGRSLRVEAAPAELVSLGRLYGVAETFGLA